MKKIGAFVAMLCIGMMAVSAFAAPAKDDPQAARPLFSEKDVPDVLKPWEAWSLIDHKANPCPFLYNNSQQHHCAWPGAATMKLARGGGEFQMKLAVYDEAWVTLPGNAQRWPQQVKINAEPAAVTEKDGRPGLFLAPGNYTVTGSFLWDDLPESLTLPQDMGVLALEVNGAAVAFPEIDAGGTLWIRHAQQAARDEADRLEIKVFRHVIDSIPLEVETRLMLNVAGKHREVNLGRALLDDFVPMELGSDLPARLEPDGTLRMQIKPGSWAVTLLARHPGPVDALTLADNGGAMPKEEIWAFEGENHLRMAQIEGVPPIDPAQTELPQEWRGFPAYYVKTGDTMTLIEKKRGDSEPAPDQLSLSKEWWLDFSGEGFTVRDAMRGEINRSWRLDAGDGVTLGRVAINGRDQFITTLAQDGKQGPAGVEVRQGPLEMEADARLAQGSRAPLQAVGWRHEVQSLRGTLHLPPGWSVLHIAGADAVSQSWIERWSLLDIFLVLITIIVMARLHGRAAAAVSVAALVLLHHEMPGLTSSALFILAASALLKVLPQGRARAAAVFLRRLALLLLIISALPFMVMHLREAIYPQLKMYPASNARFDRAEFAAEKKAEPRLKTARQAFRDMPASPPVAMAVPAPPPPPPPEGAKAYDITSKLALRASRTAGSLSKEQAQGAQAQQQQQEIYQYDPGMKSNTGFGVSDWQGNVVNLTWNGPVDPAQTIRLWLISPFENLALAFLRVVLLAALLMFLVGMPSVRGPVKELPAKLVRAFAFVFAAWIAFGLPGQARAEDHYPPQAMIEELRRHLLEERDRAPRCLPECAQVSRGKIDVAPDQLTMTLELHADREVEAPLPGGAGWRPQAVLIDGAVPAALRRGEDGFLYVIIGKGVHQVQLMGRLPQAEDTVTLSFPMRVHHLQSAGAGWDVQGIRDDGVADRDVQLVYSGKREKTEEASLEKTKLPAFVQVERAISFGLSWEATTTVRRLTPPGDALAVEIPLLEGETVTSADVPVKNGRAFVNLGAQATEKSWTSRLDVRDVLALHAPALSDWPDFVGGTEIWRLNVSNLWHAEFEGIPRVRIPEPQAVAYTNAGQLVDTPTFVPWPGETLTVRVTRPEGVAGQTVTIDKSRYDIRAGQRAFDATLDLSIRSSQGGQHVVTLPPGAKLGAITINGAPVPPSQKDNKVTLPLTPGAQNVRIAWNQPQKMGAFFVVPAADAGLKSVNAETAVTMPPGRWILFAYGPAMGPAVLFWGWIPVILLASLLLGRLRITPLSTGSWFLLLLGMSQTDLVTNLMVAGWLLLLGWRERNPGASMPALAFNLRQVALAALTLFSLRALFDGIRRGLLGSPDMKIMGNGSYGNFLQWYQDIALPALPMPWVFSLPVMAYRLMMLAWALWLAFALVRWMQWAWRAFSTGGLWRGVAFRKSKKSDS